MGLSPLTLIKGGLKAVGQSLLKEACELVVFGFPGVNAWAREKSFAAAV